MTTAAEIVRMQADLLDAFRTPDPKGGGLVHAVQTAAGRQIEFPVSTIGRVVDHLMFGPGGSHSDPADAVRGLFASTSPLVYAPPSAAPMVANGLSLARAYRVQENMTAAVVARADALNADRQFGVGEGQIEPPRAAGFAFFCEPVPHMVHPGRIGSGPPDPAVGLISWTAVVDLDDDGDPRELAWVVVVWDDMKRTAWPSLGIGKGTRDEVRGRQRFVPVTAWAIRPGALLGWARLQIRKLGEPQMRSPLHTVAALWQLLGETVPAASGERVSQEREPTDKADRRRARMAGMSETPEVTTVVLRRESKPVQNPGTGAPHTSRVEIDEYTAWRWIGSEARGDRRKVRRTIRKHWSSNDESLPVRHRTVVSELKR